jgi:hypothetical protein
MGGEDSPLPLIYTQMKKQTAVEILVDTIFNEVDLKDSILKLAISQAKELEKQQMKDFVTTFLSSASPAVNSFIRDEFEKYYNETYNS